MVSFVTLFLGLVAGVHPVTVDVNDAVAVVELVLDGQSIGVLSGKPWTLNCDFGTKLEPHELVVVARDREGKEVGRDRQWVNLPRPRSEVSLVVERDDKGFASHARILWQSVESRMPDRVRVTFDGELLPITQLQKIELPDYDRSQGHILTVDLELGNQTVTAREVIGGGSAGDFSSGLTAVPVFMRRLKKLPNPDDLKACFSANGKALDVVAIERGPADVVVVLDQSQEVTDRIQSVGVDSESLRARRLPSGMAAAVDIPRGVAVSDTLRKLFPFAQAATQATQPSELFPITPNLAEFRHGVFSALTTRRYEIQASADSTGQRISDGVAVAGLVAASGGRARAVVLLLDPATPDESHFKPAQVEDYLTKLNVPLVVWSPLRRPAKGGWGDVRSVSKGMRLVDAVGDLGTMLQRQVIVWVSGQHLPQDIELSKTAAKEFTMIGGRQ